jgi:hypothetical protein
MLRAFGWLFAALATMALLSQPGATHDEWFHLGSIWCAQGIRQPSCTAIDSLDQTAMSVELNIEGLNCKPIPRDFLYCPTDNDGTGGSLSNNKLYPGGFYFILSWFVGDSGEFSVFMTRAASALIVAGMLFLMMATLPARHRLVLVLIVTTMFVSSGFYLFASINPSSWSVLGVGTGWLPIHAALGSHNLKNSRRLVLFGSGMIVSLLAVVSRWDALPYLALMVALVSVHSALTRLPGHKFAIVSTAVISPLALWAALERFTPLSPVHHLKLLTTFSAGQPDNVMFISTNLLQSFVATLRGLGTIPTMTQVDIPGIVMVASFASLGVFLAVTFNRNQVLQLGGLVAGVLAVGLASAAQIAVTDLRDVGNLEPRYGLPLSTAIVGWWYLMGPEDLLARVGRYLKFGRLASALSFSLVVYTVAERFVDKQTYTLRLLPEGPDQWWWSWMPVGPNVPMIIAPVFFWFFIRRVTHPGMFQRLPSD